MATTEGSRVATTTVPALLRRVSPRAVVSEVFARAGIIVGGDADWDLTVHDERFFARVLRDGSLGLGESYMDGWWDSPRLDELVYRLLRVHHERDLPFIWRAALAHGLAVLDRNSVSRSRRVIDVHYDLGNDMFQAMLGRTMTYSCGYWARADGLDAAQDAKHELIVKKLGLGPGDRVLDIGCGWGGFAHYAATRVGCHVVGITLSEPQARYARAWCAGLPVQIEELDYRDARVAALGPFTKVVSVGMFEHVGRSNYRAYMQRVASLLPTGGMFLLHTVGRHASKATDPWVSRYIFPGGMLPSTTDITDAIEGTFVLEDWHNFGADYDRTLMAWHRNCEEALCDKPLRFQRMWRFYLLAFAGNFRARYRNQLWQVVLTRGGAAGGYISVR